MKSHEAMKLCLGRHIAQIARRLHVSKFTLYKWSEPSEDFTDSGSFNPLDRLEFAIESSMALGAGAQDALAPVRYLEERFGLVGIPLKLTCICPEDLSRELMRSVRDFGRLIDTAGKALADGQISKSEARRIEEDGWTLIRQVTEFMYKAKEAQR